MRIGIEGRLIVAYDGKEHRLLQNGIIVYENNTIIHVGKSFSGALDKKITAPNR